jgi:hypothetical protein
MRWVVCRLALNAAGLSVIVSLRRRIRRAAVRRTAQNWYGDEWRQYRVQSPIPGPVRRAEPLFRKAADIAVRTPGEDDPRAKLSRSNLCERMKKRKDMIDLM